MRPTKRIKHKTFFLSRVQAKRAAIAQHRGSAAWRRMSISARLAAVENELAHAKVDLKHMAEVVTYAKSAAYHVVRSLPAKASKAMHVEITGSPGPADVSGRCTSILNARISEEAERKATEIISFFETADAAEVSEDAEGEEHEDDEEHEEEEGAEVQLLKLVVITISKFDFKVERKNKLVVIAIPIFDFTVARKISRS